MWTSLSRFPSLVAYFYRCITVVFAYDDAAGIQEYTIIGDAGLLPLIVEGFLFFGSLVQYQAYL